MKATKLHSSNKNKVFIALITSLIAMQSSAKTIQHNLSVDGITCPFCVATSAKSLRKIKGVTLVDADLEQGIIKVCADESADFNNEKLTKIFLDNGFTYRGKKTLNTCQLK